jgi:prepilin-type processing-associated H-X9-DG protein
MYQGDNNDWLMNSGAAIDKNLNYMDWTASTKNIDTSGLTGSAGTLVLMAGYIKAADIYKCPADNYQSPQNPGPRTRSVALNGVLAGLGGGSGPVVQGTGVNPAAPRSYYGSGGGIGRPAQKVNDLNTPGPVNIFVFLDEQADSIDDLLFMYEPGWAAGSEQWRNLPASYHNRAGSFSFADGHSEIHKWMASKTVKAVSYTAFTSFKDPNSADYQWLDDRMPYR